MRTNGRFYLYEGRQGQFILTRAGRKEWDYLVNELEQDDRMSIEESIEEGFDVSGSFEQGYLSVDDGGSIRELELTEVP